MSIDFILLGNIFKEARERNKLSLEEVGKELKHSAKWISRVEKGEIDIRIDILFALCNLYSLDLIKVIKKVQVYENSDE